MGECAAKIPDDAPIMVAWRDYQTNPRYFLAQGPAPSPQRIAEIWSAFLQGWQATGQPVFPIFRKKRKGPHILLKWSNWFVGFSWGDDAISVAFGPVAFTWDR